MIDKRSTTNSTSGGPVATATALAAFNDRVGYAIQNQATAVLFLKFGAGCSTTVYDITLKGGAGAADGSGAALFVSGPMTYTGIITVAATGTASYTAVDW